VSVRKFWIRRAVLAAVWGLAISTWASIAHHLMGMPDIGPVLVIATVAFILVRPAGRMNPSVAPTDQSGSTAKVSSPT
jgi:hypothetical protein